MGHGKIGDTVKHLETFKHTAKAIDSGSLTRK